MSEADVLHKLAATLALRKQADPLTSYVASLYGKGLDAILKKIGEESTEVIMAAKDGVEQQLIHETADLWFHSMVLLAYLGVELDAVLAELERRDGKSGFKERSHFKGP